MSDAAAFFVYVLVAAVFSAGLLAAVSLIRYRRNPVGDKTLPYECGVDPATPTARESYSIRFYLLTLVFIVFEVETFFLFPWAVVRPRLSGGGVAAILAFLAILGLGYVYAWKTGSLDFRRTGE